MELINSWLPPSREHWELITWLWQFFPLVRAPYSCILGKALTLDIGHDIAMAIGLLSARQNIRGVSLQYSRENSMGDNGGTWLYDGTLPDVHLTAAEWYYPASWTQLAHGRTVCM